MAERLFIQYLARDVPGQAEEWSVGSAGVWAENNHPPDDKLITVMAGYGIDIRDHRSRSLTDQQVRQEDLVLVMARHHLEALHFEHPALTQKIYLLSQMIGQSFDIEDPFGMELKDYQRVARLINDILHKGYAQICRLTEGE